MFSLASSHSAANTGCLGFRIDRFKVSDIVDHDFTESRRVKETCFGYFSVTDADKGTTVLVIAALLVVHSVRSSPSRARQSLVAEPFSSAERGCLLLLCCTKCESGFHGFIQNRLLLDDINLFSLVIPVFIIPSVFGRCFFWCICGCFICSVCSSVGIYQTGNQFAFLTRNRKALLFEHFLQLGNGH